MLVIHTTQTMALWGESCTECCTCIQELWLNRLEILQNTNSDLNTRGISYADRMHMYAINRTAINANSKQKGDTLCYITNNINMILYFFHIIYLIIQI